VPYTLDQLNDIHAIQDLAKRYCRGVDRLDPEEMRSAYWPEANDNHGGFNGNAWEFVDVCMTSHLRWSSTMHCIFNHVVELDPGGTTARGEVYNVTYLHREGATDTWWGRYVDRYEKRGAEWRIIDRVCVHESDRTDPLETPFMPAAASFRQGSFDRGMRRPIGP
jgi:hypothetical protein